MATAATNRMVNTTAQTSAGSGAGSSSWFVIGAIPAPAQAPGGDLDTVTLTSDPKLAVK